MARFGIKEQVTNFKLTEQPHTLIVLSSGIWMTISKNKNCEWLCAVQVHTWIYLWTYQEHPSFSQDTLLLLKLLCYLCSYTWGAKVGQFLESAWLVDEETEIPKIILFIYLFIEEWQSRKSYWRKQKRKSIKPSYVSSQKFLIIIFVKSIHTLLSRKNVFFLNR